MIDRGCDSIYPGGYDFIPASVRRVWNLDNLPTVRCFMCGRGWRSHFGVEQRPIAAVKPPWWPLCRLSRRWVLVFTLEEDVRERVLDELQPGVVAMWSDPRDWLGL